MSPGNSVWAALLWDCSPTFLLWACREWRLYLHSLQFCLFLVDDSSLNSVFSNQSSLQLGRITEILLWLRILEIQTESFSNQYLLRYSRKKKKNNEVHIFQMTLLIYGVPSKGRDLLFFHLSLISESKSGSWFAENRQNSHWYRPQEVIYIGCEHNHTQWPTKLFMLVGKIFPNEQFPMATNVMQCSRLLVLSPLWWK